MKYGFRVLGIIGVLLTTSPGPAIGQTSPEECETQAVEAGVVRTDARSKRLFVVSTERDLVEAASRARIIGDLQSLVAQCQPTWQQDWSVSFFSNAASAGYKDEQDLSEQVMSGRWADAYLGEFAMSERKLTVYPAVPAQSQWYVVE